MSDSDNSHPLILLDDVKPPYDLPLGPYHQIQFIDFMRAFYKVAAAYDLGAKEILLLAHFFDQMDRSALVPYKQPRYTPAKDWIALLRVNDKSYVSRLVAHLESAGILVHVGIFKKMPVHVIGWQFANDILTVHNKGQIPKREKIVAQKSNKPKPSKPRKVAQKSNDKTAVKTDETSESYPHRVDNSDLKLDDRATKNSESCTDVQHNVGQSCNMMLDDRATSVLYRDSPQVFPQKPPQPVVSPSAKSGDNSKPLDRTPTIEVSDPDAVIFDDIAKSFIARYCTGNIPHLELAKYLRGMGEGQAIQFLELTARLKDSKRFDSMGPIRHLANGAFIRLLAKLEGDADDNIVAVQGLLAKLRDRNNVFPIDDARRLKNA